MAVIEDREDDGSIEDCTNPDKDIEYDLNNLKLIKTNTSGFLSYEEASTATCSKSGRKYHLNKKGEILIVLLTDVPIWGHFSSRSF